MTTDNKRVGRIYPNGDKSVVHSPSDGVVHPNSEEYLQRLKQQEIVAEFGKVEYDADYDYKQQRNAPHG